MNRKKRAFLTTVETKELRAAARPEARFIRSGRARTA